jgi:DNA polymerase I-like protein with 3'-5' exonuclease and polymerase domains
MTFSGVEDMKADLHDKTWNNLSGGAPYSTDHDTAKRQRTIAKTCNFGLLYGAGANALISYAKGMGVEMSLEEATQYRDAFFSGYPRLLPWHSECVQNATNFGYSQTPQD